MSKHTRVSAVEAMKEVYVYYRVVCVKSIISLLLGQG